MEANKENQQSIEQAFEQALDAYKAGNFAEAAGQWLALAEDGCAPAQRALGSLYERGQGVEKNAENAFEWTKKAAEQNDPVAMFMAVQHRYRRSAGCDLRLPVFSQGRSGRQRSVHDEHRHPVRTRRRHTA